MQASTNFVEWFAYFDDTQAENTMINLHKCTEEDYADFNEIVEWQKPKLDVAKEKNMFYCFDKNDQYGNAVNLTMYGDYGSGVFREISLIYRPCLPK